MLTNHIQTYRLKRQPHKMVKHTQTMPANCLSVFDHFVALSLKGLLTHFRLMIPLATFRKK